MQSSGDKNSKSMADKYKIQSVIIAPGGWIFDATTAQSFSDTLTFVGSKSHEDSRHIVSYQCEAKSLDEAWRRFYKEVEEFIEAAAFQTSSYLSFHDWNHLIVNQTKQLAMIVVFPRTLGTSLTLYTEEHVDDVNKVIANAKQDKRLKNFLHCYRMAILVDAPETQDAYEKYLLFACEALAGEIEVVGGSWIRRVLSRMGLMKPITYTKYDKERLVKIIGKELHKYFFSSLHPVAGKTIRNANMHTCKSPNEKASQAIKLVNRLREFVAKEYGLTKLTIIKEENSPTRGLYRDNGQRLFFKGKGVDSLELKTIRDLEPLLKNKPKDTEIIGGKDAMVMFEKQ
jgi:hypothetical protein